MSGSSKHSALIAERYTTALFELAEETKVLDSVAKELATIDQLMDTVPELARAVKSPIVSREEKAAVLGDIAAKLKLGKLTQQFLEQLAEHNRVAVLPIIKNQFDELLAQSRGEASVKITVATPLSEKQKTELLKTLEKSLGKKLHVNIDVNESLIAGLTIQTGSRLLDCSVRGKLQNLEIALNEAIAQT